MKILKYLIKPLELVVLLGMLAALIYFRSVIFHSNVNYYIDAIIVFTEEQFEIEIPSHISDVEEINIVAQIECPIAAKDDTVDHAVVIDEAEKAAPVNDVPVAAVKVEPDETTALIGTLSDAVSAMNKKVDMLFDMNNSVATVEPVKDDNKATDNLSVTNRNNQSNSNRGDLTTASTAGQSPVNVKQGLSMARQLFWNGNPGDSERIYFNLTHIDGGNPDVYGELGNVYYSQGKWKLAGEAYYEAAIRLLATKNNDKHMAQIHHLLKVIQGIDAESALKLRNKISG